MRTLLVKLQFKLASWLYNKGIIAPQLLEHKKIRITWKRVDECQQIRKWAEANN